MSIEHNHGEFERLCREHPEEAAKLARNTVRIVRESANDQIRLLSAELVWLTLLLMIVVPSACITIFLLVRALMEK